MAANASLIECMAEIEDPRIERTRSHELLDILVLAVLAVIAGAEGWEDIEDFGKSKLGWLKKFIRLKNGVPSHDTIARVFRLLRPNLFQQAFLDWVSGLALETEGQIIAIDGKALRRSHDKNAFQKMLHCVSAWSVEAHVVLGQQAVDEKSNEITAIPLLLQNLELKGSIVTIDAMGCQKEIAAEIIKGEGDYVLALKENQPTLYQAVDQFFTEAHENGCATMSVRSHTTRDQGHGRKEARYYFQAAIPETMRPLFQGWKNAKTICQVISLVERDGKETSEIRYYIASLELGVKKFAKASRGHWGIENSLHWVLDVTFNEDQSRIRKGHGPENFALLRRFALSIIKQDKSKGSVRKKRKWAAWDENYFLNLLATVV